MRCLVVVQFDCHPEQAFFAQRKPALSGVEGDLGEPREGPRSLRTNKFARLARFLAKLHHYPTCSGCSVWSQI